MTNKAFYFSIPQFYFLIVQHNLHGLMFFEQIRNYTPEDQEIADAVMNLTEESMLLPAKDAYTLNPDIRAGLDILDRATCTCISNSLLPGCLSECLYMAGEACLSVQMDELREGYVRAEAMNRREVCRRLLEHNFMPDSSESGAAKVDLKYAVRLGKVIPGLDVDARLALSDEHMRLVVDEYRRGAFVPGLRVTVYSDEGVSLLSVRTAECVSVNEYSRQLFLKYFEEG